MCENIIKLNITKTFSYVHVCIQYDDAIFQAKWRKQMLVYNMIHC